MTSWRQSQPTLIVMCAVLFLLHVESASAQDWVTRVSTQSSMMDETAAICSDDTYSYVVGSVLNAAGNWDVVVACIDVVGNIKWIKQWDLGYDEKAEQLLLDNENGLIVALTQWTSNGTIAYLARWSTQGLPLWHGSFPDRGNRTTAVGLALLKSGDVVFAYGSEGMRDKRCVVSSMTVNGAERWTRYILDELPVSIDAYGNSVALATMSTVEPVKTWFQLFDSDGVLTKSDGYAGAGEGRAIPVCLRNGISGFFLGGNVLSEDGAGIPFVLHYSHSGLRQWVVLPIVSSGRHRLVDLRAFPEGGVVMTAREQTLMNDADIYLARIDGDGKSVWAQSFDRPGSAGKTQPPLFAGISGGWLEDNKIALAWPPARDDVSTRDEICYNIYASDTQGGQDFSSPTLRIKGGNSAVLEGLNAGMNHFFVVRAVDAFGNEDMNRREIMIPTASLGSSQSNQSRR